MITDKEMEILDRVDWRKAARLYYGAGYNDLLIIWKDGEVSVLESGTYLRSYDDVLVSTVCPGLHNLDTSEFTEGFRWDDEADAYVDPETGHVVGDLWDCVLWAIEYGDESYEFRSFVEQELEDQKRAEATEKRRRGL